MHIPVREKDKIGKSREERITRDMEVLVRKQNEAWVRNWQLGSCESLEYRGCRSIIKMEMRTKGEDEIALADKTK